MPRQSSSQYYHAHNQLRRLWLTHIVLYAELSFLEQRLLHYYLQPSKDLSKDQLLAHRTAVTKRRPGIPRQAGGAYAKFQTAAAAWAVQVVRTKRAATVPAGHTKRGERVISVKSVMRPEPDLAKLARALLQMAKQDHERKNAA